MHSIPIPMHSIPTSVNRQRLHQVGVLLLLGVLALVPRLLLLGAQSLWLDEGSTWQIIQSGWGTLWADVWQPAAAYPLYHLLLKGWTALAGESEWALRLPSALAGAAAVPVLYLAALELQRLRCSHANAQTLFPTAAALLLCCSPFAIWYAQEAKVYSLLLLVTTLLLWSLLYALRVGGGRAWLLFGGLALLSVCVHRLALLLLLAAGFALLAWTWPTTRRTPWWPGLHVLALLALLATSGFVVAAMVDGLGSGIAETGAYIPAGVRLALWLTLLRFTLDRGPDEASLWWLLPWLVLMLWGGWLLLRDLLQPGPRRRLALVLLCLLLVPLLLFLAQLAFTRLYESRYLLLLYPTWCVLLAYPAFRGFGSGGSEREKADNDLPPATPRPALFTLLVGTALAVGGLVLLQPERGLFSGYPVKEQYREAVAVLAETLHPDDLLVLHPAYIEPLYRYYMARQTADPAPPPVTFAAFKHLQTRFNIRDWDNARRREFAGSIRSLLLIAPRHARTVDAPPTPTDEYGLVGLYYQYSREQEKWPCGIWRFNGVHVLCQDSPEAYETGAELLPATPLYATFGPHIVLHGYTLKATTPAGPGTYRAGGTLPVTLFWDVLRPPAADYSIFLHLCQQCELPPPASRDAPPMQGYLPTSVWTSGNLVHDERTIPLPPDLPPGRYRLLVGVYNPGDPTTSARLPVTIEQQPPQGPPVERLTERRLLLTTVELMTPDGAGAE